MHWNNHIFCFATSSFPPPRRQRMERQAPNQDEGRPVEGVWPTAVSGLSKHTHTCFTEVHRTEIAHTKCETDPQPALDCAPKAPRVRCSWGGQGPARCHLEPGARYANTAQKAPGQLKAAFKTHIVIFSVPPHRHSIPASPDAFLYALLRPTRASLQRGRRHGSTRATPTTTAVNGWEAGPH